jgi:hypothetical protein
MPSDEEDAGREVCCASCSGIGSSGRRFASRLSVVGSPDASTASPANVSRLEGLLNGLIGGHPKWNSSSGSLLPMQYGTVDLHIAGDV